MEADSSLSVVGTAGGCCLLFAKTIPRHGWVLILSKLTARMGEFHKCEEVVDVGDANSREKSEGCHSGLSNPR